MRMPGIRGAGNIGPLVLQQQQMELDRKRQKQEADDAAVRNILAGINTGIGGLRTGADVYTGLSKLGAEKALMGAQTADIPRRTDVMQGRLDIEKGRAGREEQAFPLEQRQREEAIRLASANVGKIQTETDLEPRRFELESRLGNLSAENAFRDSNTRRMDVLGRQKLGLFGLQNEDRRLTETWGLDKAYKQSQIDRNKAGVDLDRDRLQLEKQEFEARNNAPSPAITNQAVSAAMEKLGPYIGSGITHESAARDAALRLGKDPFAPVPETAFLDSLLKVYGDQAAMTQIAPILRQKYGDKYQEGTMPQAQDWPAIAQNPEVFARVLERLYDATPDEQEEGVTGQLLKLLQQGGGGPDAEFYNRYLSQLGKQQHDVAAYDAIPEAKRTDPVQNIFGPLMGDFGGPKYLQRPPAPPHDASLIEAAIRRYLQFAR